ncbi:MAG: cytochrome c/FTR1 family iron permease [Gammaproteobacteria bacterium]|nr:cytochrome c/FTR1 family iron permease [Gammaproteobacteria bacterium]
MLRLPAPLLATVLCLMLAPLPPALAGVQATSGALLHTLDYLAVDYPGTVSDGQVVNVPEYAEQVEFAARLETLIGALPEHADKSSAGAQARAIATAISSRAPGAEVQQLCRALAARIVRAYAVTRAPARAPSLARGLALYEENCASCHGASGFGDGPAAATLDPAPNDFHERARQQQRSAYGLYSTITLGVDGTAMTGYAQLSEADRWALSFHVANYLGTDAQRARGRQLWQAGSLHAAFPDLTALTAQTPEQVETLHGGDGLAVLAYLRSQPETLAAAGTPISHSRRLLAESLASYHDGQVQAAYELAVAAYLEGFELAEAGLRNVAGDLVLDIETAMMEYRTAVRSGVAEADLAARVAHIDGLLATAQQRLDSTGLSAGMAFVSSFVILFREGLEAILVLAAIGTFLVKTDKRQGLRYVHAGWMTALALGVLTWIAAKYLIDLSGASRELTEGFTALFAAAMLVYVGCWLHDHAHAERWQHFIKTRIEASLSSGTLWTLGVLAFVAVYREIVETILFYETLWLQTDASNHHGVLTGFGIAAVALGFAAWGVFRVGMHLPLKLFFRANTIILFILAVVFAGKGIAALQEAGTLGVVPLDIPTVDALGIYPTLQSVGLQLALVVLMLVWVGLRYRQARPHPAA